MAQLNTRIVLRNDSHANWNDQILLKGEVGLDFLENGKVKMKVGDGVKPWNELEYFGGENSLLGDENSIVITENQISIKGFADALPGSYLTKDADGAIAWIVPEVTAEKVEEAIKELEEKVYTKEEIDKLVSSVYHFKGSVDNYSDLPTDPAIGDVYNIINADSSNNIAAGDNVAWDGEKWDKLGGLVDLSNYATIEQTEELIKDIAASVEYNKYEVFSKPEGTLVRITEDEVRIMCPADTDWVFQSSGENANPNSYYVGLKIYAPNADIYGFKEEVGETIVDQTMYRFEDNEFAGIDENGRKYSIIWLPVAVYDSVAGQWVYYGANSTSKRYIGWSYSVEWYDINDKIVASDSVKINLSNESCHNFNKPYYVGSINVNTLVQSENEFLILYGGSATDNI